ncbi:MAG: hypothetical protein U1F50_11960 [Rubrivivax sp.]
MSPNGRFAFTANAGSGNVGSYAIARDGSVTLSEGAAGSTGANSGPVDMAMPRHGRSLAVLAGRAATVMNFSVAADGIAHAGRYCRRSRGHGRPGRELKRRRAVRSRGRRMALPPCRRTAMSLLRTPLLLAAATAGCAFSRRRPPAR